MIWRRAVLLSLGLLLLFHGEALSQASRRPIRIGVIHPTSGPFAVLGEFANNGVRLALEEVGYRVGSRTVEVIFEDTQARPDVGLTRTRKLVEQDRVDMLMGPISSAVGLAIRDYVVSQGVPWIITQSANEALTREKKAPNIFRVGPTDSQTQAGIGRYLVTDLRQKRIVTVALDMVTGHELTGQFERDLGAAGGRVVEKVFLPMGGVDAAPYIARVVAKAGEADAVNVILWGADAFRFLRQSLEFGLATRIAVIGYMTILDSAALESLRDIAPRLVGTVTYGYYSEGWDHPANRSFVEAYRKKTGKIPTSLAVLGYTASKAALEALKAVEGRAEDRSAFMGALEKTNFVAPSGLLRFDENRQALASLYVRKLQEVDGVLMNVPIAVVPNIKAP